MRTLSVLRHAKSSWDDPVETDFDRPLNGRGRRAAVRMGRYLREQALVFDRVVASPALRVRQTIEGVEEGYGRRLGAVFDKRIYMASFATLLEIVQETADEADHLLLLGHNPGLEDLVLAMARDGDRLRGEVLIKYPTAALATLEFKAEHWAEVDEGGAAVVRFVRPRDLDPSLGPDM